MSYCTVYQSLVLPRALREPKESGAPARTWHLSFISLFSPGITVHLHRSTFWISRIIKEEIVFYLLTKFPCFISLLLFSIDVHNILDLSEQHKLTSKKCQERRVLLFFLRLVLPPTPTQKGLQDVNITEEPDSGTEVKPQVVPMTLGPGRYLLSATGHPRAFLSCSSPGFKPG